MFSGGGSGKIKASELDTFGWYGKILFLAGQEVQNIKYVEKMKLYDFLTALSYKLAEMTATNDAVNG